MNAAVMLDTILHEGRQRTLDGLRAYHGELEGFSALALLKKNKREASAKDFDFRPRRFGAPPGAAVACAWVRACVPATAGYVPEDRPGRTCPWQETRRLAIRDRRCALYWRSELRGFAARCS